MTELAKYILAAEVQSTLASCVSEGKDLLDSIGIPDEKAKEFIDKAVEYGLMSAEEIKSKTKAMLEEIMEKLEETDESA